MQSQLTIPLVISSIAATSTAFAHDDAPWIQPAKKEIAAVRKK